MKTLILEENQINEAAASLKNGGVVAFPTETVYGVGVVYDDEQAFNKLVAAKKRPATKPFTLMCSSTEECFKFIDIDERAKTMIEQFLPGELTVIVKAKKDLPNWVTLGSDFIGIRVPDSKFIRDLFKAVGKPCLVTSANKSGEPTLTTFEQVKASFDGEIEAIVKGKCVSNLASTIIKIDGGELSLIREGPITFDKLMKAWEAIK